MASKTQGKDNFNYSFDVDGKSYDVGTKGKITSAQQRAKVGKRALEQVKAKRKKVSK